MTSGHLIVQLGHGTGEFQITVFAVHIVRAGSGVVAEPNSIVFDDARVLLDEFDAVENFTSRLLHLTELTHKVPKLGFGRDGVGCEDDHAVGFGVGVVFGGSLSADHLILAHLTGGSHDDDDNNA